MAWIVILFIIIFLGAFFYILKLRRQIAQIEYNEIKKMEARRSGFISIISHQLRTPLSVIKGYLEALITGDQGPLASGQKEYLTDALKINKESIKLVNEYLDVVRLDTENIPVNPQVTDLTALVRDEVKNLKLLAKAYNCDLKFIEPAKPLQKVTADPTKIRQVIGNIIANAVKYTSGKGEAVVTLEEKDGYVVFKCRDTGVGIPEDQQAELFTKFFRAKNIIHKDTKGSGIGLFLAKMIIEALGGKIWVKSSENKGTTVTFQLPKHSSLTNAKST